MHIIKNKVFYVYPKHLTFWSSNFKQVQLQGSALVSQGCQK